MKKYKEIFKLKRMLEKECIPFDWIECFGYSEEKIKELKRIAPDISEHYQICYPCKDDRKRWISVIEGYGTYGGECDKLEIMGGKTPWEEFDIDSPVIGYLTANNVFKRIKNHYDEVKKRKECE